MRQILITLLQHFDILSYGKYNFEIKNTSRNWFYLVFHGWMFVPVPDVAIPASPLCDISASIYDSTEYYTHT